jgi:hypothetical protein
MFLYGFYKLYQSHSKCLLENFTQIKENDFINFFFFVGGFETGFLCIALAVLELTL